MTFPQPTQEPTNADIIRELRALAAELRQLNHLITGNGTPEKGHVVRLDRLEQKQRDTTWFTRTAVGAWVVAIVAYLFSKITGGG